MRNTALRNINNISSPFDLQPVDAEHHGQMVKKRRMGRILFQSQRGETIVSAHCCLGHTWKKKKNFFSVHPFLISLYYLPVLLFSYCSLRAENILELLNKMSEEHCNNHHCKVTWFWPRDCCKFPKMLLMNRILLFSLCFYTRDDINVPKISLLHKWASVSCRFFMRQKTSLWKLSPWDKGSLGCETRGNRAGREVRT